VNKYYKREIVATLSNNEEDKNDFKKMVYDKKNF